MDLTYLTTLLRARFEQFKSAGDTGQSTTELAVMAAVLIVIAGLVVAAIRTKVLEKIGIINGG
ncbi:hypothetical protein [Streptomyces antibioticus]|uniref:hypothetical protein n=1 Tax=Streptomyces antibioticus TaxID=1890 RepID=UPI0004CA1D03|nr:hypothetical protein [Streptomyces antibioticus]MBO7937908.1 hypothetical protein [Streptomyces sp. S9]MCX4740853.1 hypothetical protein [Streptomyces antibioticus]